MHLEISREDVLLDTGGGLKKAAWFFLEHAERPTQANGTLEWATEPFLLHNVDVISTIDFRQMLTFHIQHQALATVAVQERESSRYLLFDGNRQLCGRQRQGSTEMVRAASNLHAFAFCGIHVISPRLLTMITEDGAFSIIDTYLRLAASGEKILAFDANDYYWRDLGKPQNVLQAEEDLKHGFISL
jgi:NDP-sugar pyrophosphorylase family protein